MIDVSVIVPCYNQGKYLTQCLNSVLAQTTNHWECIVVDDGSVDNTPEISQSFVERDTRFSYHFQDNKGLSSARNAGLRIAKGAYVVFLDSDDLILPAMLETLVNEFHTNAELDVVFSGYFSMDENLKTTEKTTKPYFNFSDESFFRRLCKWNLMPVHTVMLRRELMNLTGFFDETLKSCEDWDLWLRVARITNRVKSIALPLVIYRMSANSMTRNAEVFFQAGLTVLERSKVSDDRVKSPLAENMMGYTGAFLQGELNWYKIGMGQHLANRNSGEACRLASDLLSNRKYKLTDRDFMDVWKNLLLSVIMLNRRTAAWELYGDDFIKFLNFVYKDDDESNLVRKIQDRIKYHNASLVRRIFMKIFIKGIRKSIE